MQLPARHLLTRETRISQSGVAEANAAGVGAKDVAARKITS